MGAVVLDSGMRVLAVGYNGAPAGQPGCLTDHACPRGRLNVVAPGSSYDTGAGACIANHAEANALLYSDPLRRVGGLVAVTHEPCGGCSRLLAGAGLHSVIWPGGSIEYLEAM